MNAEPAILQMKYADIIKGFAKDQHFSLDEALKIFYNSELYQLLREGVSDLHCMSEQYLIEDLKEEFAGH